DRYPGSRRAANLGREACRSKVRSVRIGTALLQHEVCRNCIPQHGSMLLASFIAWSPGSIGGKAIGRLPCFATGAATGRLALRFVVGGDIAPRQWFAEAASGLASMQTMKRAAGRDSPP